jgi:cytochrome P450 family 135
MNSYENTTTRNGRSVALPPGPRMPSTLQAVGWALRPLAFMERCQARYGDIFTLRIQHAGTWVFLCDPEDVKRVFTAAPEMLGVSEPNSLLAPTLGTRSVMLLEEPEHMTHRKRMLPSFHGQRMRDYGEMMDEVTRKEVRSWPLGEPFELWPRMQSVTLEVIMRAVFGPVDTDRLQRLRGLLRELTDWINDSRRLILLGTLGPRWILGTGGFRRVKGPVEDAVLEEIRRRRMAGNAQEGDDIFAMIEQAYAREGTLLSEPDMQDELITLLLDGPTSTSLAWVFERLLRHPAKLARLHDEVLAGEEDTYLDAVVKETLRLCPPVPVVVRRLEQPMELGGHTIPTGTTVAPCIHLLHRRTDVYPSPRSFMPERFLEKPAGTYTWIPFGGGVRRCLAASFAQVEMKRVIRTVLREVELRAVDLRSERVARSSIAFAPHRRGLVVATRREVSLHEGAGASEPDPPPVAPVHRATAPAGR